MNEFSCQIVNIYRNCCVECAVVDVVVVAVLGKIIRSEPFDNEDLANSFMSPHSLFQFII